MFKKIDCRNVGISKQELDDLTNKLESSNLRIHTLLIAKGDGIFYSIHNSLYNEESIHRMYSSTKSLTSLAIGLLYDRGLIKLSDKVSSFFPEYINNNTDKVLLNQTIEDTLKMGTCVTCENWFMSPIKDRVKLYFSQKHNRNLCEKFEYDSAGTMVLGTIVEKVTNKNMYDYAYENLLSKLDYFKDAYMLKTPTNNSWADSGLMCSSKAMLELGRLVLNKGKYNNEQLISEEYITKATSKYLDTLDQNMKCKRHGYGYQIWMINEGYAFFGMGNQVTLIYPQYDCVATMTGDCFDNVDGRDLIVDSLYQIIKKTTEIRDTKSDFYHREINMFNNHKLNQIFISKVDALTFVNDSNSLIQKVCFNTKNDELILRFYNNSKEKKICVKSNATTHTTITDLYSNQRITLLPEYDTYDLYLGVESCDENNLVLQGQIVGDYFALMKLTINIKNDSLFLSLKTYSENFLLKYNIDEEYKKMD